MNSTPLRICLASSEIAPLAKTGGLADVTAALARYLDAAGHDIRVLVPRYARIDRSGLDVQPVAGLADLSMRIGDREIRYAIDRTMLPGTGTSIYLLRCPEFFAREGIYTEDHDEYLRFVVLSRAAIEMCQHTGFAPDIFHCHDWQTALVPLYLKSVYAWDRLFAGTRTVLTIHNIGYQGMFPAYVIDRLYLAGAEQHLHQDDLKDGVINFLKTGILYADLITTVSPTYAREILGDEYGMGLNHLLRGRGAAVVGILNGVDYSEWNPETDGLIPANYSASDLCGKVLCKQQLLRELGLRQDTGTPLIGVVSRLVSQKGIDLLEEVLPRLITRRNFALAVLGSGASRYEDFFEWLMQQSRERVCFFRGFNNKLAHWIEAAADMFVMPSLYEPCGLNQMYSMRYGTVPIVRETGGLADSVEQVDPRAGTGTGILFRDYNAAGLTWALDTALDLYPDRQLWLKIAANGMARDFSWERQGARYVDLFRQLGQHP